MLAKSQHEKIMGGFKKACELVFVAFITTALFASNFEFILSYQFLEIVYNCPKYVNNLNNLPCQCLPVFGIFCIYFNSGIFAPVSFRFLDYFDPVFKSTLLVCGSLLWGLWPKTRKPGNSVFSRNPSSLAETIESPFPLLPALSVSWISLLKVLSQCFTTD